MTDWRTARFTVRRWVDDELTGRAFERHAEQQRALGATVVVSRRGHDEPPSTWESVTRSWVDKAGRRTRTEEDGPHGRRVTVLTADHWSLDPLLDPANLRNDVADEFLVTVDEERGVVLRTEARVDGRPFDIREVTDIAFDEPFEDDLFRNG